MPLLVGPDGRFSPDGPSHHPPGTPAVCVPAVTSSEDSGCVSSTPVSSPTQRCSRRSLQELAECVEGRYAIMRALPAERPQETEGSAPQESGSLLPTMAIGCLCWQNTAGPGGDGGPLGGREEGRVGL